MNTIIQHQEPLWFLLMTGGVGTFVILFQTYLLYQIYKIMKMFKFKYFRDTYVFKNTAGALA